MAYTRTLFVTPVILSPCASSNKPSQTISPVHPHSAVCLKLKKMSFASSQLQRDGRLGPNPCAHMTHCGATIGYFWTQIFSSRSWLVIFQLKWYKIYWLVIHELKWSYISKMVKVHFKLSLIRRMATCYTVFFFKLSTEIIFTFLLRPPKFIV